MAIAATLEQPWREQPWAPTQQDYFPPTDTPSDERLLRVLTARTELSVSERQSWHRDENVQKLTSFRDEYLRLKDQFSDGLTADLIESIESAIALQGKKLDAAADEAMELADVLRGLALRIKSALTTADEPPPRGTNTEAIPAESSDGQADNKTDKTTKNGKKLAPGDVNDAGRYIRKQRKLVRENKRPNATKKQLIAEHVGDDCSKQFKRINKELQPSRYGWILNIPE